MNNQQPIVQKVQPGLYPFIPPSEGNRNGLEVCQVQTPENIVELVWDIVRRYRVRVGRVVDFGAGDGRFAFSNKYTEYLGIEYDLTKRPHHQLPKSAHIRHGCALDETGIYDAVVGNPPYVRHHFINSEWKYKVKNIIQNETGIIQNTLCNMYLYFLWLSLLRTHSKGLVALVIPYEWVSRPSARQLRDHIRKNGWCVDVYRFENSKLIFPSVLTTASITVVDKSVNNGDWNYYDINRRLEITPRKGITGSGLAVLSYEKGGSVRCRRGLSPGSQKIFTLTEQDRLSNEISLDEVVPAATSFRELPIEVKVLSESSFKQHFIDAGKKCWLLKTEGSFSENMMKYLANTPESEKQRWTCQNRDIWYQYQIPDTPFILYSAGFVHHGPKFVLNEMGAVGVGSVHGIIGNHTKIDALLLLEFLREFEFENQIVAHAKTLKKVEVNQMNGVINGYFNGKILAPYLP